MRRLTFSAIFAAAGLLALCAQAPAQRIFTTYHCRDGSEFVAAFYPGDSRAHLQLDGKAVALAKRIVLGGSRYARGDITLRIAKNGATTLKRGRRTTDCTAD